MSTVVLNSAGTDDLGHYNAPDSPELPGWISDVACGIHWVGRSEAAVFLSSLPSRPRCKEKPPDGLCKTGLAPVASLRTPISVGQAPRRPSAPNESCAGGPAATPSSLSCTAKRSDSSLRQRPRRGLQAPFASLLLQAGRGK